MRKVVFIGSISPIETAISYTGDGDGQRVKFDIPETQLGNSAGLLALRRRALQITVIDLGPIEEWQPGDNPIGDEIEPPVPHQPRQALEQDGTPAAAHDVADEEDTHALRCPAVDDLVLG